MDVWIDPLSKDFDYDEPVESRGSTLFHLLAAAALLALSYVVAHSTSRRIAALAAMATGILMAACFLVPAVRRGAVNVSVYGGGETRGMGVYRRSADPVGFWTVIVLIGAVAGVLVFGSLGELLGLWSI